MTAIPVLAAVRVQELFMFLQQFLLGKCQTLRDLNFLFGCLQRQAQSALTLLLLQRAFILQ